MTLNEAADFISEGLPRWQRNANHEFLERVHCALKPSGVWVCPSTGLMLQKIEAGFEVIKGEFEDDPIH